MSDLINTIQKFAALCDERTALENKIETTLESYLKFKDKYAVLSYDSLRIENNCVRGRYQVTFRGETDYHEFSVTFDYFENPEKYIAEEKAQSESDEKLEEAKELQQKVEQEKAEYKRLEMIYGGILKL